MRNSSSKVSLTTCLCQQIQPRHSLRLRFGFSKGGGMISWTSTHNKKSRSWSKKADSSSSMEDGLRAMKLQRLMNSLLRISHWDNSGSMILSIYLPRLVGRFTISDTLPRWTNCFNSWVTKHNFLDSLAKLTLMQDLHQETLFLIGNQIS